MGWNQSWEDMVKKLPSDDCRFVVFMWERSENRFQPLYIIWAPETSRIKTKMIYCSSAYPLKYFPLLFLFSSSSSSSGC